MSDMQCYTFNINSVFCRAFRSTFFNGFLLALLTLSTPALAQQEKQGDYPGSDTSWELGAHAGRLLPNQINGVEEIVPQWGLRTSFRSDQSFWEIGGQGGNGNGVKWASAHVSLRFDIPVEGLLAHVFLGADVTRYSSETVDETLMGGGHVGGGFQTLIGGQLWFRTDMKFNLKPGVSMYLGFGFVFKYPEGSGSGAS